MNTGLAAWGYSFNPTLTIGYDVITLLYLLEYIEYELTREYLPIIPDPIMELMKLKHADITEPRGSPATSCGGINAVPSSLFGCKTKTNKPTNKQTKTVTEPTENYQSFLVLGPQKHSITYLMSHFQYLSIAGLDPASPHLFRVYGHMSAMWLTSACKRPESFTPLKPLKLSIVAHGAAGAAHRAELRPLTSILQLVGI